MLCHDLLVFVSVHFVFKSESVKSRVFSIRVKSNIHHINVRAQLLSQNP